MTGAQSWNPDRYARNARFVAELGMPVFSLLDPKAGERILDLGCGDGALTEKLVEAGCDVVGVDGSAEQIEAACQRGLNAQVMDGQQLTFENEFDAVFSNAAMHWMNRPDDVISGVRRALKPEGRFVSEMGGFGCVRTIESTLLDMLAARGVTGTNISPWYFPTDTEYRSRMETQGFRVDYIALIQRPTPLPGDVAAWLETFAESFTNRLPESDRPAFLEEVRECLRPKLCNAEGLWTADYVRLRFTAVKTVD